MRRGGLGWWLTLPVGLAVYVWGLNRRWHHDHGFLRILDVIGFLFFLLAMISISRFQLSRRPKADDDEGDGADEVAREREAG